MWEAWANQFVGISFAPLGRSWTTGLDCYGLVVEVYQRVFGIELRSYTADYSALLERSSVAALMREAVEGQDWRRVEKPMSGDVVLLNASGHPFHCGIVVGDGYMLHIVDGANSCIETYTSPMWCYRIEGFYRHKERD